MYIKKQLSVFAMAVLAGVAIGIGGIVYLSLENKVVGALMFTVGLYTICIHGLNLYTGKVGYLVNQHASYLIDLIVIWSGNLLGTILTALAISKTRFRDISKAAKAICAAKMEDRLLSLFLLAVFCGFLMFVAVDGYKRVNSPVILFLGVATFILCGFEHCIADMFYFSAAEIWSGQAILRIMVITFGNSVGGVCIPLVRKIV